jgi:hypothetical protein
MTAIAKIPNEECAVDQMGAFIFDPIDGLAASSDGATGRVIRSRFLYLPRALL